MYLCVSVQGSLYMVLCEGAANLMTRRNWATMKSYWPALINSKHSEKPSIIKLLDAILDTVHKYIETTEIRLEVRDDAASSCVTESITVLLFSGSREARARVTRSLAR